MKQLLIICVFLSSGLWAHSTDNLYCGLPTYHDLTFQPFNRVSLKTISFLDISRLPTLTKQQIIITAEEVVRTLCSEEDLTKQTLAAVRALKMYSEGEEVYISDLVMNGTRVTFIEYFPDGIRSGVYFSYGTKTIIAYNSDGTVICK